MTMAPSDPGTESGPADAPGQTYSYKASLVGAPWEFRLEPDGLGWRYGPRAGSLPYDAITRLRLSFRPASMQSHRFLAEIWSTQMPKIPIVSTTWRSMVEQSRQDADYAAFIAALHRRLAAEKSSATFVTGLPPLIYVLGVIVCVGTLLGLGVLTLRALAREEWTGAAAVAAFLALFGWQVGRHLHRNRPGRYRPEALPDWTLPRITAPRR